MKTFEDYGVILGITPETSNADDAVELAVATYNNLGLIADEGKARESFGEEIASLSSALPESVTAQPHDIVLVPKLGELSLSGLISRYDELTKGKGNPKTLQTLPRNPLWDEYYSDEELNQGQTNPIEAKAVLLGGGNYYYDDEPGLYFTREFLKTQQEFLKEAQKSHDGDRTTLASISPAGYIIRNTMQLERGKQLQDTRSATRFIEQVKQHSDVFLCVPRANSYQGRLKLTIEGRSDVARMDIGVRLWVGQSS